MNLLKSISLQNFKCYRKKQDFNLEKSNFFIGANNAGKSAVLKALHCFFDDSQYSKEFINKTEFRSKGAGYNKSTIGIIFDINTITTKSLKTKLLEEYGDKITLYKNFTYRENANITVIDYTLRGENFTSDVLPESIADLLSKIKVSYIHPQEAKELLEKAQGKLRTRLLSNWGRNANICKGLESLQKQWSDLRKMANDYLSSGLTSNLQKIWPGCETKIDLPEKIDDIIAISEIMFRADSNSPDISLTSQGTGVQSTILYHTHFLLDSDKTLHRGFYYPIWLIEEPESFLHADIIFKLGHLLSSDTWLNNIQMLISTHSPLLLSTSKQNEDRIKWFLLNSHSLEKDKFASKWDEKELIEIGQIMGDPNFDVYFETSNNTDFIVIEDKKEITKDKFCEAGIPISKSVEGVSDLKRYFNVLKSMDNIIKRNIYFLVDNDKGYKEFEDILDNQASIKTTNSGFKKYQFANNVNILLFPDGFAAENFFEEFDSFLERYVYKLFDDKCQKATEKDVPSNLTRVHGRIRGKNVSGKEDAKRMISKEQDIKDCFWEEVEDDDFKMKKVFIEELKSLMD
jgi:AAA15 family ATPase/GTPase